MRRLGKMSSSARLAARLQLLDHEELANVAAELSQELMEHISRHPKALRSADALLSKRNPVPAWAVSQIFLSADLLPSVFSTLELEDCAASSVCSAWHEAWIATDEGRRGLRAAQMPVFDCGIDMMRCRMFDDPAGSRLVIANRAEGSLHVLDASGRTVFTGRNSELSNNWSSTSVTVDRIYAVLRNPHSQARIRSYTIADGFPVIAECVEDYAELEWITPVPAAGLLFVVGCPVEYGNGEVDEIIALDAHTLQVRRRFGYGVFSGEVYGIAPVDDELYVAERRNGCLQVFNMAGDHLRTVARGDWRQPQQLLHVDGRLYLLEHEGDEEDHEGDEEEQNKAESDWSEDRRAAGTRIFVLNLQGETLQVWTTNRLRAMHLLGHKLLVQTSSFSSGGFLALKGL